MASLPIQGVAESYVFRPFLALYIRLVKSLSLGAVLAVLTLPVYPVLHFYGYLFLSGIQSTVEAESYPAEAPVFWYGLFGGMALYFLLGGGLARLGIPSALRRLRKSEPLVARLTSGLPADDLRDLLRHLAAIPVSYTRLAVCIYLLQIAALYTVSYVNYGNSDRLLSLFIIDLFVIVMLLGLVYSIVEFSCSFLRMRVKQQLAAQNEAANDLIAGQSGLLRLLLLLFVGTVSMLALVFFLRNDAVNGLSHAIQFSLLTFLICGTLVFIYVFSWVYSLRQLKEATHSVAMGGRGHLPMLSNDREMIEVAVNFDSATYEIDTIRNYLTELVDEKTRTLSEAYNEMKQLKSRQDGDYYLTSNLIEALTEIRPESETVVIDSLIKQFKTFDFMGHNKEIGGDMNAGYSLRLQGEKYTLVLNADAMGKSLQGAGGVLVMGSALRSLIERTQITEGLRNLSPERWLKNSFLELHRLFSSFNGSMMASMVCLLIHDNSGYTVMINAEHPRGILLRGGEAEFITSHEGLRKLGNNAVKGRLWVDTLVMQKGDVIIMGSDGRDDIVVGYDSEGQPIINEDDRRIIHLVRIAEGDLPRIFMGLKQSGEIVDDVSLLRVEFTGRPLRAEVGTVTKLWHDFAVATESSQRLEILRRVLQVDPENMKAWRALLRVHLQNNNLVDAAFITECMVRIRPDRDFLMYSCALLYYRIGSLEKALNFADRLTLRNWSIERFLVLLGKIHEARQDEHGMREAGLLLTELDATHGYGLQLLNRNRAY